MLLHKDQSPTTGTVAKLKSWKKNAAKRKEKERVSCHKQPFDWDGNLIRETFRNQRKGHKIEQEDAEKKVLWLVWQFTGKTTNPNSLLLHLKMCVRWEQQQQRRYPFPNCGYIYLLSLCSRQRRGTVTLPHKIAIIQTKTDILLGSWVCKNPANQRNPAIIEKDSTKK